MNKRTTSILPGLVVLALVAPARAATPPADLVALEQQTAALKVATMRFDVQEDVEIPSLGALIGKGGGSPLDIIVGGEGVASTSPQELEATMRPRRPAAVAAPRRRRQDLRIPLVGRRLRRPPAVGQPSFEGR